MWLDTLVSSFTLARDLSWSFSCPSHCGSSSLFPFVAGFSLGSLVTLLLIAWIAHYLGFLLPSSVVPPTPPLRQSRRRLEGYLVHEQ